MTASTWVGWMISCECQPSGFDDISALAAEMSEFFQSNEPDTTHFEWSVTDDRTRVDIHERYANSAQALTHMAAFGERFGSRFMVLLKPASVVVYGFPTPELQAALEGLSPLRTETFAVSTAKAAALIPAVASSPSPAVWRAPRPGHRWAHSW